MPVAVRFQPLSALLIGALALAAGSHPAAHARPLPERLLELGLVRFAALHDEEETPESIPDSAHGAACVDGMAGAFPCHDVDLLAFLPLAEIGGGTGNDVWGWTHGGSGREFVLMGLSTGIAFVEVSDPEHPVYLGNLPTHTFASPWRDVKVYRDHAFVVADSAGAHGLQVFDLTRLLDAGEKPLEFTEDAHHDGFDSAHNLAIDEQSGFAYVVGAGACAGGLYMVDLADPLRPEFAGCFDGDGYTHDAQCVTYHGPDRPRRGREICLAANEDTLTIVDVTDKDRPELLSRTSYDRVGYAHQGWLTEDHAFFLLDDELDERNFGLRTRTLVWDMSDLGAPVLTGEHRSAGSSIDHNQYVLGDYTYQANYRRGLRILHLADLTAGRLQEVASFDTHPESDATTFDGAWSVYPYLASGAVAISDINRGLFLVRPRIERRIFADGFESGNLRAWSKRKAAQLSVTEPGLGGSAFALRVAVDGGGRRSYLTSDHPDGEPSITVSVLIDPNRVELGNGEVEFLRLSSRERTVATLALEQLGGRYRVRLYARTNTGLELIGSTGIPAARAVPVAVVWRQASAADARDGEVRLLRKGKRRARARHLASGNPGVDQVLLGLPAGVDGIEGAGAFLLDDYLSTP